MRNSKRIKIVAGGTAALFGVGVAFAAWTSTGENTGSVESGEDAGLTVVADDLVEGLYPTGTQTISVVVTNNNPYKVKLDEVLAGDFDSGSDCNDASVTTPDKTGLTTVLDAAGGDNDFATFDFIVSMSNAATDACQNQTFTANFTANGKSSE